MMEEKKIRLAILQYLYDQRKKGRFENIPIEEVYGLDYRNNAISLAIDYLFNTCLISASFDNNKIKGVQITANGIDVLLPEETFDFLITGKTKKTYEYKVVSYNLMIQSDMGLTNAINKEAENGFRLICKSEAAEEHQSEYGAWDIVCFFERERV